jgi:release factor glutamine methyltransferase
MKILDEAASRLRDAGIESPRAEARLLLAHAMGITRENLISSAREPDRGALTRLEAAVARRCAREPFAYIVGRKEFFSHEFEVGQGVLIPRPESEVLIEQALLRFPNATEPLRVLDLGTGSGCLLLAFLKERIGAQGIGADVSQVALHCARRNAERLGLAERARFVRGEWAGSVRGKFDVIFVNPPYIKTSEIAALSPEIACHEPASALDGGLDGLDAYRRIAPGLSSLLSTKGCAFIELGVGQAEAVSLIFAESNISVDGTVTDLARIYRCLVMVAAEQQSRANRKKRL